MEDCGCKDKCLSKVLQTTRDHVYGSYRKLTTCNEKYLYLSGLIYKEKRESKKGGRKKFLFHVRSNGYNTCVCRKTFEKVHGISSKGVKEVLKKLKNNVISLDSDDELFLERVRRKLHDRPTNAKDPTIDHIRSTLLTPEVKKHILKGETLNLAMLYADYKSTFDKKRRVAELNFDDQESENNENNQESVGYIPVSLCTFKILFQDTYSEVIKNLKGQDDVNLSHEKQLPSISLPVKTSNAQKKRGASVKKTAERQNLTKRPRLLLAKKKTNRSSNSIPTRNVEDCRSTNDLYTIVDNSDRSAVYLIPKSTKIINNANTSSNDIETISHV